MSCVMVCCYLSLFKYIKSLDTFLQPSKSTRCIRCSVVTAGGKLASYHQNICIDQNTTYLCR